MEFIAYAIRCKNVGNFKKQRDWCFGKFGTQTALYTSKKRAETEMKGYSDKEIVEVICKVVE